MLQAKVPIVKTNEDEQNEASEKEDVAVVPLAILLLAGPGAISTVILFSSIGIILDTLSLALIRILASIFVNLYSRGL